MMFIKTEGCLLFVYSALWLPCLLPCVPGNGFGITVSFCWQPLLPECGKARFRKRQGFASQTKTALFRKTTISPSFYGLNDLYKAFLISSHTPLKMNQCWKYLLALFHPLLTQTLSGFTNQTPVILDNISHKVGYQLVVFTQDFPLCECFNIKMKIHCEKPVAYSFFKHGARCWNDLIVCRKS